MTDIVIKSEWYKKYGFDIVDSERAYESYSVPDKPQIETVYAKTLRFLGVKGRESCEDLLGRSDVMKKVLENLDKLFFLAALRAQEPYFYNTYTICGYDGTDFVCEPGAESPWIPFASLEKSIVDYGKDNALYDGIRIFMNILPEDKKIIVQERSPWHVKHIQICPTCGGEAKNLNFSTLFFRRRIAFSVLDKQYERILDV